MVSVLEWLVMENDRVLGSLIKQSPNLIKLGFAAERKEKLYLKMFNTRQTRKETIQPLRHILYLY